MLRENPKISKLGVLPKLVCHTAPLVRGQLWQAAYSIKRQVELRDLGCRLLLTPGM
jgi:hypothetical protein